MSEKIRLKFRITWHPSFPLENAHIIVGFKCCASCDFEQSSSERIRRLAFRRTFDDDFSTATRPQPTIVPTLPAKFSPEIFKTFVK